MATQSTGEGLQPNSPTVPDQISEATLAEFDASPGTVPMLYPNEGAREMHREQLAYTQSSPALTGGDVDADWQSAAAVGDEAVGGSVSTPDQNVVDELGEAVGLPLEEGEELEVFDILEERDHQRFELDPESSEDYLEH